MKLTLLDIIHRQMPPVPYADGEKIPWDDPAFSTRMLKEHLSQDHNAASRRQAIIDQHVDWIQHTLLQDTSAKILDLGCGPGLYSNRLGERGHTCIGLDFSPASIEYAKEHASANCTFTHGDIRELEYGSDFDLAMLIFGEFNTFSKDDAHLILKKAYDALKPDGLLLLEPHTFEFVRQMGSAQPNWFSSKGGLYSEKPHIVLYSAYWDETQSITTERYFIIDGESGDVTRWACSMLAYSNDAYTDLLTSVGFRDVQFHDSYGDAPVHDGLLVVTCRK